jgi:hypothetical protein
MRKMNGALDLNPVSPADTPHEAGEIAKAVDRNHSSFIERRARKSACQVRTMMLNEMELGALISDTEPAKLVCSLRDSYTVPCA